MRKMVLTKILVSVDTWRVCTTFFKMSLNEYHRFTRTVWMTNLDFILMILIYLVFTLQFNVTSVSGARDG